MNKKVVRRTCLFAVVGAILLLSLLVYFCIPYAPKTAAELCGDYVRDCKLVHEELTLKPDGTFIQTVTIKATSDKISSKGKWTYETHTSSGLIFGDVIFENGFINALKWPDELNPDYAHPLQGISVIPAEYWFGKLIIGGSVDSFPDWKKVK